MAAEMVPQTWGSRNMAKTIEKNLSYLATFSLSIVQHFCFKPHLASTFLSRLEPSHLRCTGVQGSLRCSLGLAGRSRAWHDPNQRCRGWSGWSHRRVFAESTATFKLFSKTSCKVLKRLQEPLAHHSQVPGHRFLHPGHFQLTICGAIKRTSWIPLDAEAIRTEQRRGSDGSREDC